MSAATASGRRGARLADDNVKPADLRGIRQYIPQFRKRTFIIAVEGAIVTDENSANILPDIAVLRSRIDADRTPKANHAHGSGGI